MEKTDIAVAVASGILIAALVMFSFRMAIAAYHSGDTGLLIGYGGLAAFLGGMLVIGGLTGW